MPYKQAVFANGEFYHIFNRGVEKRIIFLNKRDQQRFLQTINHYRFKKPLVKFSYKNRLYLQNQKQEDTLLLEVVCFCLMPNHFHLIVRQIEDGGITKFISKSINSYTKYFNTKHNRVGPLLQGSFKAVRIESDEQLVHVSRYIHLNPIIDFLTDDLDDYEFSSYPEFINNQIGFCRSDYILGHFPTAADYEKFVLDQESYARDLKQIERALLED